MGEIWGLKYIGHVAKYTPPWVFVARRDKIKVDVLYPPGWANLSEFCHDWLTSTFIEIYKKYTDPEEFKKEQEHMPRNLPDWAPDWRVKNLSFESWSDYDELSIQEEGAS